MSTHEKFRELNNPLGVHPINWSNDDFRDLGGTTPLETCFQQMQEAGYVGTEVGHKYSQDPDELRPMMNRFQLRLIGGWHSTYLAEKEYEEEESSFLKYLHFLKSMDASVVVVAESSQAIHGDESAPLKFGPDLITISEDQWERVYQGLDKLSDLAASEGLPVVYHHHMGTVVQSESSLDALMSNTKKLKLLFDTGHLTFAGINPETILDRYLDRIAHVHLKNVRQRVVQEVREKGLSFGQAVRAGVYTVPGDEIETGVDYPHLLARLAENGYSGWYVVEAEQDPLMADPFDYARMARKYIRETTGL